MAAARFCSARIFEVFLSQLSASPFGRRIDTCTLPNRRDVQNEKARVDMDERNVTGGVCSASRAHAVYIEPQERFETYLAAAIAKKGVPVDVVADQGKATYVLNVAPVQIKRESMSAKSHVAYFAYCTEIEGRCPSSQSRAVRAKCCGHIN